MKPISELTADETLKQLEWLIRHYNTSRRYFDNPPQTYEGWVDMGNSFRQIGDLIDKVRPSYYTEKQMSFRRAIAKAFALSNGKPEEVK